MVNILIGRFKRSFKQAVALLALVSTAACSQTVAGTGADAGVFQAYNTSGAVNVPPYTRTIFSSTNF